MNAAALNILVIATALFSLWKGWRSGAARELALLLGWGFAIVAVRIGADPFADWLLTEGGLSFATDGAMLAAWLAITLIYALTVAFCALLLVPLARILGAVPAGPLASLVGSVVCALQWLTALSMLLNLWGAADTDCLALRVADGGDGGVVEEVLLIAPALTGGPGFSEMNHIRQLRQAKAISQNILPSADVYTLQDKTPTAVPADIIDNVFYLNSYIPVYA